MSSVGEVELESMKERVGWFVDTRAAYLAISGQDSAPFLHALVSQDVERLQPSEGCYGFLLTPKARVIAPLVIYRSPDAFLLQCPAELAADVSDFLRKRVFIKKVNVVDRSGQLATVQLEGPGAAVLVQGLELGAPSGSCGICVTQSHGDSVRVLSSVLGAGSLRVVMSASQLPAWTARIEEAALAAGGCELSAFAQELARIEAGRPAWGSELSVETFLPDTGLAPIAVSYTKGCYPGQEPIARVHFKGRPNRCLASLRSDAEVPLIAGSELVDSAGKSVGGVTSSVGVADTGYLGLGYVRLACWEGLEAGAAAQLRLGTSDGGVLQASPLVFAAG